MTRAALPAGIRSTRLRSWPEPEEASVNSMPCCARFVHDLDRKRDLLAGKRRFHGFESYRYTCEIDQSVRNRNQKDRGQSEQEQVSCCTILT